ncbi:MAG: nucleotidyltransferase family protein [Candidatus Acidiferrum sp.]
MPRRRIATEAHLTEKPANEAATSSKEWALLVECARTMPDHPRLDKMLREPVDWNVLSELAEEHGLLGLVALRLRECGKTAVPAEVSQAWRERQRSQALFTLHLTAEMFRLFERFAAADLGALVIKGPVLAVRCHGDPGARQYGDLDLIVRDKDILRATELMIGLGYEPRVSQAVIRANKAPGEYAFRQADTKLLVEFHTERTFRYHPRPLPLEKLFERQTRVGIDAREIPALSPEDELILICIHGGKHFWERLSYIADVAAFVARQELDWDCVKQAAEEVRAQRMVYVGLQLAAEVLGALLPENITAFVRSDPAVIRLAKEIMGWLPAAGSAPPGIFGRAMFRMRMRGGFISSPAYLLRLSFSPTEEDWADGAENKRHSFLEAVGRPFRLARKYGRAEKP